MLFRSNLPHAAQVHPHVGLCSGGDATSLPHEVPCEGRRGTEAQPSTPSEEASTGSQLPQQLVAFVTGTNTLDADAATLTAGAGYFAREAINEATPTDVGHIATAQSSLSNFDCHYGLTGTLRIAEFFATFNLPDAVITEVHAALGVDRVSDSSFPRCRGSVFTQGRDVPIPGPGECHPSRLPGGLDGPRAASPCACAASPGPPGDLLAKCHSSSYGPGPLRSLFSVDSSSSDSMPQDILPFFVGTPRPSDVLTCSSNGALELLRSQPADRPSATGLLGYFSAQPPDVPDAAGGIPSIPAPGHHLDQPAYVEVGPEACPEGSFGPTTGAPLPVSPIACCAPVHCRLLSLDDLIHPPRAKLMSLPFCPFDALQVAVFDSRCTWSQDVFSLNDMHEAVHYNLFNTDLAVLCSDWSQYDAIFCFTDGSYKAPSRDNDAEDRKSVV